MKFLATLTLLLVAATCAAAEPAPGTLTWQQANKRSAALIREQGPTREAADLARTAFDLYPEQTKKYNGEIHAQLLLNLLDVRHKAQGSAPALHELESRREALESRAGSDAPVLVDVWTEAAGVAGPGESAGRYRELALGAAEQAYGVSDPRTLTLLLHVVHTLREKRGYDWALRKFLDARERADKTGANALVEYIDLFMAKLDLESGNTSRAINGYRALIDRVEKRGQHDQDALLQVAYAQLEHLYEEKGDATAARELQRRRLERLPAQDEAPAPLFRVAPSYPRTESSGFVEVQLLIGADGSVQGTVVLRAEPKGVFEKSAIEAVRQWKYRPKIVAGKAVPFACLQRIDFTMEPRKLR